MRITSFEDVCARLDQQPPARILLVHPTKYLGNLLISGHLIQAFAAWCQLRHITLAVVLDKQYESVFGAQFSDVSQVFWYPRKQLSNGSRFSRLRAYIAFLRQIRRLRPDVAFNLEEDGVASTLVRLSGAGFRLGCSQARHKRGYDAVLPLEINNRPDSERHRWYSYREVFSVFSGFLYDQVSVPEYLHISIKNNVIASISDVLVEIGSRSFVIIHPGGSKLYKRWPDEKYADLAEKLFAGGDLPVFIGAGADDTASVGRISSLLAVRGSAVQYLDLCNRLNLSQLMALFTHAKAMVGNDSGPFHLGSALGLPGVVLFGPTETGIWGPLGKNSRMLHKKQLCRPDCTRHYCELDYRCLSDIPVDEVCSLIDNIQLDMECN